MVRRPAVLGVRAHRDDLPGRGGRPTVPQLQIQVLGRGAPGVVPAHEDRELALGAQRERLALVDDIAALPPLVVAVAVAVGERAVPADVGLVASRVDPHDPVVGRPLDRVQRAGRQRRGAVGVAVEGPADRVHDHLHALRVHPHHSTLQIGPGAGVRDIQRRLRRDVHQSLGHPGAVVVPSVRRVAVDQIVCGHPGGGEAHSPHRLWQLGPHQPAQTDEAVLAPAPGAITALRPRDRIDHADLDAVPLVARQVPAAGLMQGQAPARDPAPKPMRRRQLAHARHPDLIGQLRQQRGRHRRLEVVGSHVGRRDPVLGQERQHPVLVAVELDREQHRLAQAQGGVGAARHRRRLRALGHIRVGETLAGAVLTNIGGDGERAELRAEIVVPLSGIGPVGGSVPRFEDVRQQALVRRRRILGGRRRRDFLDVLDVLDLGLRPGVAGPQRQHGDGRDQRQRNMQGPPTNHSSKHRLQSTYEVAGRRRGWTSNRWPATLRPGVSTWGFAAGYRRRVNPEHA